MKTVLADIESLFKNQSLDLVRIDATYYRQDHEESRPAFRRRVRSPQEDGRGRFALALR